MMKIFSGVTAAATLSIVSVTISLPVVFTSPALANGNGASEIAKYFNPLKKKGYLNQSQDRVIKKKTYKAGDMPAAGGSPVRNAELGLFAILPSDKIGDPEYVAAVLDDKRINGISVTLPWSTLEPKEDENNWQSIDQLLSVCQQMDKKLILRVATCGVTTKSDGGNSAATPRWVFDSGVKSVVFVEPADAASAGANDKQPNGGATQHVMPIFWDKTYLAKWANFVNELAERYDKNPTIHSIGITGGGFAGGTAVLPDYQAVVAAPADKSAASAAETLESALKTEHGMTQRQLQEHWKYVADVFAKRFQNARLNFAINAPVPHRYGEDALDEISDYLAYKYGERVYLTRQQIHDGKHRFDESRVMMKLRNDTLLGIQLTDNVSPDEMPKIAKHALDDGISFAEIPASYFTSKNPVVDEAIKSLDEHVGYKLMNEKVTIDQKVSAGQPLKASFAFVNMGAATAMRPDRNFDKDTAGSYRIQIDLKDAHGKSVLSNIHTPPTPTNKWTSGLPVTWDEELKMVDSDKHQLPAGEYTAWMSIVDTNGKRKIQFLTATSDSHPASTDTVQVGKVVVVPATASTQKFAGESTADSLQGSH
jgi:Beta-galactosidase